MCFRKEKDTESRVQQVARNNIFKDQQYTVNSQVANVAVTVTAANQQPTHVLLAKYFVMIVDGIGNRCSALALLDSGSERNYYYIATESPANSSSRSGENFSSMN